MPNAISKRYTLTNGENTYSSPAATNEADARKLQSLIPSLSGQLERERPTVPFTNSGLGGPSTPFPSRIGFFHTFKWNNQGTIVFFFFCATATTLYQLINPGPSQTWVAVTPPSPLNGFPVAVNINNTMHLSDGVNSWIFGGVDWVPDGLPIPRHAVSILVSAPARSHSITLVSRTNGVSSATVANDPGTLSTLVGNNITGSGTNFAATDVGQEIWVTIQPFVGPQRLRFLGTISSVSGATSCTVSIDPSFTAPFLGPFVNNSGYIIDPPDTNVTVSGVADTSFNTTTAIQTFSAGTTFSFTYYQPSLPDVPPTAGGGTAGPATFTVISNRYYWTTFSDQSITHPHESSASPISVGTGPFTNQDVVVQQRAGTLFSFIGGVVLGTATDFSQDDIGMVLYNGPTTIGTIQSVSGPQQLTVNNTNTAAVAGAFTIAPPRVTNWMLYASSSEEDKLGNLLASIPISSPTYVDHSPMIGTVGAYFQNVQRPLLNDPTQPSTIMEVHKNRIWRNLIPLFPNFFTYTGYEEVLAEQAGTPSESVPGAAGKLSVSPGQINETSYPDQSSVITGIRKHGDSLYIGSELNIIPLYGSSLADFQLSESQAFAVGLAGRRASCSTPFGLAFVSYDLKVYLYPSQYSFGVDSTTALVELGRPKRPEFETIDGADLAQVGLIFYNWGRRNWLVLNYRKTDQTFATWVFDFEVKGWFQLQQGYTAIGVFETTLGRKSLMGAGTDNKVYVIDDLTGNFPVTPGTNYPVGYYRILLDYTDPNSFFVNKLIAYEISDKNMEVDVTFWMDPVDPENPGTGIPVQMTKSDLGANRFTGRPNADTGATCQRILIEFAIAAGPSSGTFRGFTAEATPIPSPRL